MGAGTLAATGAFKCVVKKAEGFRDKSIAHGYDFCGTQFSSCHRSQRIAGRSACPRPTTSRAW
jgi:hypothetical protein